MGKCGKRLVKLWVYVAPDGTEYEMQHLTDVMNRVRDEGGTWEKRYVRR